MIGSGTTLSPPSTGVSAVRVPSLSQERSSRELRGQASAAGAGPAQVPEKASRPRAMKKGDKMRNLPIAEPPNCGCFPPCRFGGRQRTDDLLQEYVRKITASWQTNFAFRSEEHTSELQSLMRISYAVFCLKKKNQKPKKTLHTYRHYISSH